MLLAACHYKRGCQQRQGYFMTLAAPTDAERNQYAHLHLRRFRPETSCSAQRTPLAPGVVRAV